MNHGLKSHLRWDMFNLFNYKFMKKKWFNDEGQPRSFLKWLLVMKLTVFILLVTLVHVSASVYSQQTKLSVSLKDVSVKEVLKSIEEQSSFFFLYKNENIDVSRIVTVDIKDKSVENILDEIFKGTTITYEIVNRQIVLMENGKEGSSAFEQQFQKTVTGKATDQSGAVLPGVTVVLKGSTIGTITDASGHYTISNVSENSILQFSFIGMKPKDLVVGSKSILNITLEEETIGLQEVVAIGYGTSRKSDITGAVATISTKELKDLPNPNILDQVQGRIAGLAIQNTNASPGADPSILIRGINSITASTYPLVILDGIPYTGSVTSINPSDIESFNVLKDASSTAIYGSRGSNGVILITTKKGLTGAPTITYDGTFTQNSILNKIPLLNGDQYKQYKDDYGYPLQASEKANYSNHNYSDWLDLATRKGFTQDHELSIRGGNDKFNYYTSLGELRQTGIIKGSEYNRTSIRVNGTYFVTNWLEVGTQLNASSEDSGTQGGISITNLLTMSPLGTPYNTAGTNTIYPVPEDPYFTNPLDGLNTTNIPKKSKLQTNLYSVVQFPFIKGLTFRLNYGRSEITSTLDQYNPVTTVAGMSNGGGATRNNSQNIDVTLENILKYNRKFGDHNLDITALYSYQEDIYDATNTSGSAFINDNLAQYGVGTGTNKAITTSYWKTDILSQMGRFNYSYKSKYALTYTIRRDGYSGFGINNKWGVFSSGALAWTISEEKFLHQIKWLNYLKLRASYGTSGNQAIGAYGTLTRVTQQYSYFFDNTAVAFAPTSLGNPSLGWESTNTLNLGVDFNILKNRINGAIEFYKTSSNGLILSRSLNSTQGFSSILQNVAGLENRGMEINLTGIAINKPDFKWDINLTYAANRNKIVKLFDENKDDIGNGWFIGQDINSNFGYVFDGVFRDKTQIAASAQPTAQPGDAIVKDVNGDGKITPTDRTIQGSRSPKFTMGLNNKFTYKNFDLSLFIYTLQGAMSPDYLLTNMGSWTNRANFLNIDFWRPNHTTATYPGTSYTNALGMPIILDRSFIRLKNLTLGYTFDKKIAEKIGIKNLRVYVAGNNLLTKTKWFGFDPETVSSQYDLDSYPSAKSFVLGINVVL